MIFCWCFKHCSRRMDNRNDIGKLELSLKWNNFTENIVSCLESSYGDQDFVDVTLACEGGSIKAHRLILSASSLYFCRILKENQCPHPIVILKGICLAELEALLVYMYHGEVRICEQDIPRLLEVARFLEIRGLTTPQDKKSAEKVQITSNGSPENLNNNSEFISSELKSILLDNQDNNVLQKQCRQMPKLQSILQTELSSSMKTNTLTEKDSSHQSNQQSEQMVLENIVKEEVDDFSNDSMMFEIENSDSNHYSDIKYNQHLGPQSQINNDKQTNQDDLGKTYSYQNHKLAFYEPRPCPKCNKMYRDAATLRTHTSIMHEVLPQRISCSCGAKFFTKYDMYTHRKRGHK